MTTRNGIAIGATAAALTALLTTSTATQFIAAVFDFQGALGSPLGHVGDTPLYAPWSVFVWSRDWADHFPKPFAIAHLIVMAGWLLGALVAAACLREGLRVKPFGKDAWADRGDIEAAGLFAAQGSVLGKFEGELLAFDGPEHQILIGASRSGKGRGHIVPTILSTPHSLVVLDVKGELADGDPRLGFPGTAGFRETLGPTLRFSPTKLRSIRINPLFETPRGEHEVRAVQNLTDVLFGAYEDGPAKDFWSRSAAIITAPVMLHVLYTEPLERKTLAVVREKLRNLAKTADEMRRTLHRFNPATGKPEVHPEILHAAESFLAGEARMRSGIQATAESMFGLFGDELIAHNTATSDFRIGDLMAGERPVTLYLQPPPGDAPRLMPLMRVIVDLIGRSLMESQTHDNLGRPKRHRLVLVLDEFPSLERITFFEKMMGAMAGYGIKVFIACQSLNHITRAYGRDNVILDNCHLVTSFSAADNETAKRIAEMAGEVWEVRESETQLRPKPLLGWGKASTTSREERRPLLLAGDVRALPRDRQLIFVAGSKPIRARKIHFDEEPIFRNRLMASTQAAMTLTTTHDWAEVRALGMLDPPPRARRAVSMLGARAPIPAPAPAPAKKPKPNPKSKPAPAPTPAGAAPQGDLFAASAAPSISERASAIFRHPDGSPKPHPAAGATEIVAPAPEQSAPPPSRRRRPKKSKGI